MLTHNVSVRPSISSVSQPNGHSIVSSFHTRHQNFAVPSSDNTVQQSNCAAAGTPNEATCPVNTTNAPNGVMNPPNLTLGTGHTTLNTARVPNCTTHVPGRRNNPTAHLNENMNPYQQACQQSQFYQQTMGLPPSPLRRDQSRQTHHYSHQTPQPLHPDRPFFPVTLSRKSAHPPAGDAVLLAGTGNAVSSTALPPIRNVVISTTSLHNGGSQGWAMQPNGITHALFPETNQVQLHAHPVGVSGAPAQTDANGRARPCGSGACNEGSLYAGENTLRVDGPTPGAQFEYPQKRPCQQQHQQQNQQSQHQQQQQQPQQQQQQHYPHHQPCHQNQQRQQQQQQHQQHQHNQLGRPNQQYQYQRDQSQQNQQQPGYENHRQQPHQHHPQEEPRQHQRQQPQHHPRWEPQQPQQHQRQQPQGESQQQPQQHQRHQLQQPLQYPQQEPQGQPQEHQRQQPQQPQQHQRQQPQQHQRPQPQQPPQHNQVEPQGQPRQQPQQPQQHQRQELQQLQHHQRQQPQQPQQQPQQPQHHHQQEPQGPPQQQLQQPQQHQRQEPQHMPRHHQEEPQRQPQQHQRQQLPQQPQQHQRQQPQQPQQHQRQQLQQPQQHQRQELHQPQQHQRQQLQQPQQHQRQEPQGQPHQYQRQQPQGQPQQHQPQQPPLQPQQHQPQQSQQHQPQPQHHQPQEPQGQPQQCPRQQSPQPQQHQRQQPQNEQQQENRPVQQLQQLHQHQPAEPCSHHSDQKLREARQLQLSRYEAQVRCPIQQPAPLQPQQHQQLHQGQVLHQPWHDQQQTQLRPPQRPQKSQQMQPTIQPGQPIPNQPQQREQMQEHPQQYAQQSQQHRQNLHQLVAIPTVPAAACTQQAPSLAVNCGNASHHQVSAVPQKERSPSAQKNATQWEFYATACTPIPDGQVMPTLSACNPCTVIAADPAECIAPTFVAGAEPRRLTVPAVESTIVPADGCVLSARAPPTLPITAFTKDNKRPHHPMDDDIDDNFIEFVQPENCPLPAFPTNDTSPIFGRHRKKVRRQRVKPKPELKRRLALWRTRIDGGDKTLIYVPLDGVLMEKGGTAFRQHKEDKRVLAKYDVTDKPARSSLPERMVRDLFIDREAVPDSLHLSHYGIPPVVSHSFAQVGVKRLYEWQAECLSLPGVLDGTSLVYCAPTSGGKSLVAELLMMRRLLFNGLRGLYILPYVSICAEKVAFLRQLWGEAAGVRVEGFFSSQVNTWHKGIDVAVCTIEKASGVLNRLFEENRIRELGTIVMDELHLMQDGHRGYLLELMLLKLKLYAQKRADVNIQVIGLSATLPNVDALAAWMGAALYQTTFRPVPLQISVQCNGRLFDQDLKEIGPTSQHFGQKDYDGAASLCWDAVHAEQSVLCFCPTKARCEKAAVQIAELFSSVQPGQAPDALLQVLEDTPAGMCPILAKTLPYRVAYHHAGLTTEERAALEAGFHDGTVRVLCCTSTLAAGVNLPCRRVIVRGLSVGTSALDQAKFKQMAGRAGRAGLDTFGECFLLVQGKEYDAVKKLLDAELPPLVSAVKGPNLVRAFLETLCLGLISSADELHAALLHPTDEVLEVQSYLLARGFATEKVGTTPRVWAWAQSSRPNSESETGQNAGTLVAAQKCVTEEEEGSVAEPSTQWSLNVQHISATQLTLGQENAGISTPSTVYGGRGGGRVVLTTPRAPLTPVPDRITNDNEQIGATQASCGIVKKSSMVAPSLRPPLAPTTAGPVGDTLRTPAAPPTTVRTLAPTPAGPVGDTLRTPAAPTTVRTLEPTPLADAATFAAMPPAEGLLLYQELAKVHKEGLLLDSELHLVYLCAPFNEFRTDWQNFNKIMGALGSRERNVAKHVGANEGFIIQQIQNPTPWPKKGWEHATSKQLQLLKHTRFFVALVVFALLHEQPLSKVAKAFQLNRGDVQGLQSFAGSFCGVVTQFCVRLRWWHFKAIFEALQPRISFGVTDDILPLVQCGLYAPRARLLFEKGYDVEKLARAEPAEVINILSKHQQFELRPREFICKMATDIITAAQNRISSDAQQLVDEHSDSFSS